MNIGMILMRTTRSPPWSKRDVAQLILTVDAPMVSGLLESITYSTALVFPGSTTAT